MTTPVKKLPVLFRTHRKDGSVVAVFPTIVADVAGHCFQTYEHVGQHGCGTWGWYLQRAVHRPSTPAEYESLLRELQGIYGTAHAPGDKTFELVVVTKVTEKHLRIFNEEARRIRARGQQ